MLRHKYFNCRARQTNLTHLEPWKYHKIIKFWIHKVVTTTKTTISMQVISFNDFNGYMSIKRGKEYSANSFKMAKKSFPRPSKLSISTNNRTLWPVILWIVKSSKNSRYFDCAKSLESLSREFQLNTQYNLTNFVGNSFHSRVYHITW